MNRAEKIVCGVVVVGWAAAGVASAAVTIETVPVGNPGNAADTRYTSPGFGSVGYTYNIGKYEVTAGQYTEFLNAVAGVDTYGLYNASMANTQKGSGISRSGSSGSYTYSVDAAFVNRPVNCVSYWDACRFANWLSNGQATGAQGPTTTERGTYTLDGYDGEDGRTIQRNPGWKWAVTSEDEWYKAAYYDPNYGGLGVPGYWVYPTSSNWGPGRDLNDVSGNNANYYGDPSPIQSPYYTTIAGEFQNSDSAYATFDQGGNVLEWNEAIVYQGATYASRGFRGGSFGDNIVVLRASARYRDYPTREIYYLGFRVAEVPEPGTFLLLALGGLAVLRRRRQRRGAANGT